MLSEGWAGWAGWCLCLTVAGIKLWLAIDVFSLSYRSCGHDNIDTEMHNQKFL